MLREKARKASALHKELQTAKHAKSSRKSLLPGTAYQLGIGYQEVGSEAMYMQVT